MVFSQDLLHLPKQIWQRCAYVACNTLDLKAMKAEAVQFRKSGVEFGRRNLDATRKHDKLYVDEGQLRECLGRSAPNIANGDQVCAAAKRDAAAFTMSEAENGRRMRGDKVVNDCVIYSMVHIKTIYLVEKVAARCKR